MSVTPSPAPEARPTSEAPPVLLWRLYRPLDPEAAARAAQAMDGVALCSMAHPFGPPVDPYADINSDALRVRWGRLWVPLWLGPGLWGAGLGAGLVAACWGLAAVLT